MFGLKTISGDGLQKGARPNDIKQFNLLCKLNSDTDDYYADGDYFTEVDAFAALADIISTIALPLEKNITIPSIYNTINIKLLDGETITVDSSTQHTQIDLQTNATDNRILNRKTHQTSMILIMLTATAMGLSATNVIISLLLYLKPFISPSMYARAETDIYHPCDLGN